MAATNVKYFSGRQEVKNTYSIPNAEFEQRFPGIKGLRNDSFSKRVGHPIEGPDAILPLTRIIFYKKNPSLHKCDVRCQSATGNKCECQCGGKFHGGN